MIPAHELRLGNWIKDSITGTYHTVDSIALEDEFMFINVINEDYGEGHFNPIPLTPKLLVKCGFVKRVYVDEHEAELYEFADLYELGDGFILTPKDNGWFLCDHSITKMPLFTSLHQLQNLVFSLTGEELEVKW